MVPENPSLYDLFDSTSLYRWKRLVSEGELPTKEQLAEIVGANAGEPLPPWLIELVLKGLRGELKQRPGRPKQDFFSECRFAAAQYEYPRVLRWLKHRDSTAGLRGGSRLPGKKMAPRGAP
jgi:hypothetical protein